MIKTCSGLSLALCLLLATSNGYAESGPDSNTDQNISSQKTSPADDGPHNAAFPVRIVEPPEEAEARKWRETVSAQNEKEDLRAQNSMAMSATYTMYFTGLQLLVSIGGFAGLFYTLYLTRAATRLAEESNQISRDTAKRQLRAYLSVTVAKFGEGVDGGWLGMVQIDNTGQTPAEVVEYSCIAQIEQPPTRNKPIPGALQNSALTIGAAGSLTFSAQESLTLSPETVEAIRTYNASVRLTGHVRYRDVFQELHELHFARIIHWMGASITNQMNMDHDGRNDST